jgi:Asp/Glu/Hydantoin racemase
MALRFSATMGAPAFTRVNLIMRIACLHTAQSNVAVFEAAARQLGIASGALHHVVRADLLAAAESAGGLTDEIARDTREALLALSRDADAVVLTCSTLGPSVQGMGSVARVPVLRVDAALATAATRDGGKVVALCAVQTTVQPTTQIFDDAAKASGAMVQVRVVPGAWALFKAGDQAGYLAAIAHAAEAAYAEGAGVVALAQASMAAAAPLVRAGAVPLDSPMAGLAAALAHGKAAQERPGATL